MTSAYGTDSTFDPGPDNNVDSGCCCFRARSTQGGGQRAFACSAGHRTCILHLYVDAEKGAHCYTCMAETFDRPLETVTGRFAGENNGSADQRTVVIVPHALHMCGTARHCLELAREFSDRGFRIAIAAVQGGGHWGHKFLRVANEVILGTPSMTWGDIIDAIGPRGPAFVTAHYDPAIKWALQNVPTSVPTFAHFHTEPVPTSEDLVELLADATRRCRRVFFPSLQTLHKYRELLSAAEHDRLSVMPNALPRPMIRSSVAARNLRAECADTPRNRLAVVSRLDPDKFSIPLFIATVRALREAIPSLTVRVAGTGEDDGLVRRASREAGLVEFVNFLGYVEDIVDVYKTSDAVFVSSYTEAMPYTAIEAAAVGVPCVVPSVGYFAPPAPDVPGVGTFEPGDHHGAFKVLRSAVMREPPFDRIGELPLALRHETWSRNVALSYELYEHRDRPDRPYQADPGYRS